MVTYLPEPFIEHWKADLDLVLNPAKKVTKPRYFELVIPFDIGERALDLPCKVVRSEPYRGGSGCTSLG